MREQKHTKTNEICGQCATNMAIPFTKALDTFVKRILQSLVVGMGGHGFPALEEELEAWYNVPDSGSTLT